MATTLIKFEQANPVPGKDIPVPSPDMFIMHMNRAFGAFPVELGKDHLERLAGMAATWTDMTRNPYEALIGAIKQVGAIRVWAEYNQTGGKEIHGEA